MPIPLPRKPDPSRKPPPITRLTLQIGDTTYALRGLPLTECPGISRCFELKKLGTNMAYVISTDKDGARCDCADFVYRREGLEEGTCKHCKALKEHGLIESATQVRRDPK